MRLSPAQVRSLLPHRYPMLLVDQVLHLVPGERLTAVKAITLNEPWYERLGPDPTDEDLAYPEVLLLESWGQAAGLLAMAGNAGDALPEDTVMLLGGMGGVTFHRSVLPGDRVEHRVRVLRALRDTVIFEGEGCLEGETVFEVARMVLAFRPGEQLAARPLARA